MDSLEKARPTALGQVAVEPGQSLSTGNHDRVHFRVRQVNRIQITNDESSCDRDWTMAEAVKKDRFTYQQQSRNFMLDLRRFHDQRGTAFSSPPSIAGREVDLYLLYTKVTGDGGYEKVNNEDKWEDFHHLFHLPVGITNASQALKQVYSRYLYLYEKLHYFGEDPDQPEAEDEAGPHKSKTPAVVKVAMSYNYRQHLIAPALRQNNGLSRDVRQPNLYERLEKSLLSGLPNEVDFALNVCTLLSNEGRHVLHLDRTNNLMALIMAHVGVYDESDGSLLEFHQEWMKLTGRNFIKFWCDSIHDTEVRDLIFPGHVKEASWDRDDRILFNKGRDLGMTDVEGQRIMQLASLIQNLSFEVPNQRYMAANILVFRFVLLCIYSQYGGLHQTGLDTMANICNQLILEPIDCWTTELILKTVVRCLASSDKQDILKGMEILTNLCQVDENDQMISEHLEPRAYKNIIQQLLVADIQLLIHTLEVLYQLSELGEQTTDHIAAVAESVDVLVSLVTVEAGSFGPGALQGIRVVEYTVPAQTPASAQQTQGQAPAQGSGPGTASGASPQPINQRDTPILADPEALATCATWFKCNFEGHPLCSVNKAEIYKVYVDCMQRNNFSVVNPADFMKAIKLVYPEKMTIAHVQRSNGTMDIVLKGMRRRPILREFPPPKEGRHKNSYNFLKQAQAVSNVPRVSSPGPSGSSGSPRPLLPLAGPILPPLSPHMSPPPSPATPPPNRYQSPQPSKNSMVKNLLVSRVSSSAREQDLKRRAASPLPTGKVKAARSLSPSYEDNCHLEVCGDVERAQDVVRNEQLSHEARIERIENQCANNNTDSSNRNGLNGHIGPMGDGVQNGPLNELTNRIESQKAVKKVADGSGKLMNGVVENGDHLVNGYVSEDSNLVPSTGAEDQDELLMAINNISQENDEDDEEADEVETAPVVFKADVPTLSADGLSDSQSLPGLVDEDTADGFSGEPVLNGPQAEVMDIQTIQYDADAADSVLNGVAEDEDRTAVTMMMTNGQMDGNDDSEDEVDGDNVADDVIPDTVSETSVGVPEQAAVARTEGKCEKSSAHVRKLRQGVEIVKSSDLTDGNGESEKDNDDEEDCSGDIMQEAMKEIFGSGSDLDVDENSRSSIDTTQSIPPTQQPIRIVSNTVQSGTVLQTGTVVQQGTLVQSGTVVQPGTTVLQSGATVLQNGTVVQPGSTVMPRTVVQSGNTFVQPGTTVIPRTIIPQGAVMQQPGGTIVQQGAVMQSLQTNTVVSSVQTGTVVGIPANASNVIILTSNSAGGAPSMVGGTSTRLVIQPNMVGKPLQITIPAGQKQQIAIATPQGAVTATAKVVTAIPQTVVSSTGNIIQTCGLVTSSAQNVIHNGQLAPNTQPLTLTPQGQVITKLITTSNGQLVQSAGAPVPMMAPQGPPPAPQGASIMMKKLPLPLPLPQVKPKPAQPASVKAVKKAEKMIPIDKVENMCEWDGCKKCFENAKDVFYHVYNQHLKAYGSGPCLWECCDRLYRQRFSLVTHVQDRHCSDSAMRSATQRRVRPPTPTSGAPPPPPPPPPIYPHDAAVQAIRRFSARPPYQEFMEAKEGPVTKHIRLTSALILRNLARYSAAGRSLIKKYEHRLSYLALSPVEASTPISNCLWELHQHH